MAECMPPNLLSQPGEIRRALDVLLLQVAGLAKTQSSFRGKIEAERHSSNAAASEASNGTSSFEYSVFTSSTLPPTTLLCTKTVRSSKSISPHFRRRISLILSPRHCATNTIVR